MHCALALRAAALHTVSRLEAVVGVGSFLFVQHQQQGVPLTQPCCQRCFTLTPPCIKKHCASPQQNSQAGLLPIEQHTPALHCAASARLGRGCEVALPSGDRRRSERDPSREPASPRWGDRRAASEPVAAPASSPPTPAA